MATSTFFNDHRLATNVIAILIIALSLIFLQFVQVENNSKYLIYLLYLFPVMPSCVLMGKLVSLEAWEIVSFIKLSHLSSAASWVCLVISVPFWIFVYMYLQQVVPNTYGISKHPCFCLKKKKPKNEQDGYADAFNQVKPTDDVFKGLVQFNINDPIKIMGLCKEFGELKAVDNVCFTIKQGEIFTILGHNGAGKTTLIYMLTGVLSPSHGMAEIYG